MGSAPKCPQRATQAQKVQKKVMLQLKIAQNAPDWSAGRDETHDDGGGGGRGLDQHRH